VKVSEIKVGMPVSVPDELRLYRVVSVDGTSATCVPMAQGKTKGRKFPIANLKKAQIKPIYPIF